MIGDTETTWLTIVIIILLVILLVLRAKGRPKP